MPLNRRWPDPASNARTALQDRLDAERRPAPAGRLGVRVLDGEAAAGDGCRRSRPRRPSDIATLIGIDEQPDAVRLDTTWSPVAWPLSSIIRPYWKPEQPPPCTNTRRPALALFSSVSSSVDLRRRRRRHIDHQSFLLGRPRWELYRPPRALRHTEPQSPSTSRHAPSVTSPCNRLRRSYRVRLSPTCTCRRRQERGAVKFGAG